MTRVLRTARAGAVVTFMLAGLLCGSMTVRIPALSDKLGLSEGSIGITLLVWGLGALITMQSMRGVMARFGSRSILRVGAPLSAVALALLALAPTFPLLLVATGLFGMAFGAVDVAMNAQGSTVERAYGRPLMNGMHAGWCVGAISSGLLGTAAIAAGLSLTVHLTLVALVALPLMIFVSRTYLPDSVSVNARTATRRRMPPVVYLLGVIAFCAFMVEGTIADWNGLYLRDILGAPEAVAALGIAVATVSPMAMSLAGDAVANPGPAIAQTGAMGYAGLLLGPVIIGLLSDLATLRVGLGIAVVLGVLIALAARFLPRPGTAAAPAEAPQRELSMAA
jgi:MFS family permease